MKRPGGALRAGLSGALRAGLGGALLAGLAAACGGGPEIPPVDRVVLVTIDTLRADHVGSYGDAGAETPTLDLLAASGVRFEQAIAPTPLTRPSHASMLTGLEPPEHGVRGNAFFSLPPDVLTVAERFSDAGFATAAFVAAFVLDGRFGLDQGFDVYGDETGQRRSAPGRFSYAERPADEVVDEALAWVREAPERFFLWVHLYDPHADYDPPPPFAARHAGDPYAGEIAFADAQVGRLVSGIRRRFGPEGLGLVVTSDHGESLGEHGEATHMLTLYDATQRVPLILYAPGLPRGARVVDQVRLVDVAPTLLELADVAPLGETTGRSLLPLALGERPDEERVAYLEALEPQISFGWSPVLGVRAQGFKYLRAPRPELYDLAEDPRELRNVAAEQPERVARLDARVEAVAAARRAGVARTELDAEARARLESLGYLMPEDEGIEEATLGVVGGRDPKDHMQEANALQHAGGLLAEGDAKRALALLAAIERPGRYVLFMRANAGIQAGRHDRVVEAGQALVTLDPDEPTHSYVLGLGYLGLEALDDAERAFEQALAQDPENAAALFGLGLVAQRRGRNAEALAFFRRADAFEDPPGSARLELARVHLRAGEREAAEAALASLPRAFVDEAETQIRLAEAEREADRQQDAIERLRALVRREPRSRPAWSMLAEMLQQTGRLRAAASARERLHDLDPNDPGAQNDLAWSLALAGIRLDDALRLARRASAGLGRSPAALDTLATVHLARGEAEACLDVVREALRTAPEALLPHLRYLEAAALAELGRDAEARRAFSALATGSGELVGPARERADALAQRLGVPPLDS